RLITGNGGAKLADRAYSAFGRGLTTAASNTHEQLEFTGHERDSYQLDYMHARYYDPMLGRFLSVDPARRSADAREPQSWNRYAYADNNPLKFTDPNGREKLRFELTTRIPMPTVIVPVSFGGVNRVFHGDAHGNTFRTRQTFTIETNAGRAGSNPVLSQNQVAGQTVEYSRNGSVKGTATATQVGSISGSFQNGLAVVDVKADSANPMVSGAPAINTDLRIVATSTGEFAVGGSIDGFPSASLTVTNEQGQTFTVFDFDPRSVGNGPFSLMPGVGDQQINVACTSDGTCDRSQ
ncbi:MAG TPA: RHS repeat-associated core domain-containing protein, partial [Thermoanaerobaculia bacterium]|nr:RHS repeat-associated core domain-containing protein [Thermoanaerobaculia bacterium]